MATGFLFVEKLVSLWCKFALWLLKSVAIKVRKRQWVHPRLPHLPSFFLTPLSGQSPLTQLSFHLSVHILSPLLCFQISLSTSWSFSLCVSPRLLAVFRALSCSSHSPSPFLWLTSVKDDSHFNHILSVGSSLVKGCLLAKPRSWSFFLYSP